MEFLETSDYTDESRKNETYLQFMMMKHYIKSWKISQIIIVVTNKFSDWSTARSVRLFN